MSRHCAPRWWRSFVRACCCPRPGADNKSGQITAGHLPAMTVTLTSNPVSTPSPARCSDFYTWARLSGKKRKKRRKQSEMSPANISEINMEMSSAEKVCSELRPTTVCVCVRARACVCVCVGHSVHSCLGPIRECQERPGPWKVGSRRRATSKELVNNGKPNFNQACMETS